MNDYDEARKKYVLDATRKLYLPVQTRIEAMEILREAKDKGMLEGKNPRVVSAAAVYVASIVTNNKVTQYELAYALNVTEISLRQRAKKFIMLPRYEEKGGELNWWK